jgi:transposase
MTELGHITKQGRSILHFLLVEAAQATVRSVAEWRSKYFHLALRRGRKIAKIAMARKRAVCPVPDVAQGMELWAVD